MNTSTSMRRLPAHTWFGLAILLIGQALVAAGVSWMAIWLTPVMWTGLIVLLDGMVYSLRGASWLTTRPREFPLLGLASVGVWLLFEAYNLHLRNWHYLGLPAQELVRDFGYFWSFATIMPGVFAVSELVEALLERLGWIDPIPGLSTTPSRLGPSWAWALAGLAMVTVPLALPKEQAAYLFGAVWIGFFLLLDPLNARLGLPSLRRYWARGVRRPTLALLLGGLLCGFLWEAWNQQAAAAGGAYWIYTFPDALRPFGWRYGQMPVLGLLGFPPFALELYAFYQLLRELLGGERVFGARRDPPNQRLFA